MASQLLERKMNNIAATGAQIIATGNPGCMMQIALGARQRGLDIDVVHPVELLDQADRTGGLYDLPARDMEAAKRRQRTLLVGLGIGVAVGLWLARRRRQH